MKKITLLFLLLLSLLLVGCSFSSGGTEPGNKVCSHKWGEAEESKEATCQATGKAFATCSLCGETKEVTLEKLDHHVYGEDGHCVYCDAEEDDTVDPVDACTHTWNAGVVTKAATCKEAGTKTFKCTLCSETKSEPIAKLTEHTYNGGVITTKATCKAAGVKTYTCTVCAATKTETIAQLTTHSYNSGVVTKAATCKEDGVKTFTCTVCSATKTSSITKLSTHSWNAGVETKKATCTVAGTKTFTCSVCGATKTETVAATGHVYKTQTVLSPIFTYHTEAEWSKIDKGTLSHYTQTVMTDSGDGHIKVTCTTSGGSSEGGWEQSLANLPADTKDIVFTFSVNRVAAGTDSGTGVREMICKALRLKNSTGQLCAFVGFENKTTATYADGDIAQWTNGVTLAPLSAYNNQWIDIAFAINIATKKVTYYVNGTLIPGASHTISELPNNVAGYQACYVVWGMGASMPKNCDVRFDNYCCYAGTVSDYAMNTVFAANNATNKQYPTYEFDAEGYVITKAATCKEAGTKTATCTKCGETVTKAIPKLTTHTLGVYTVTKEPTETATGTKTATCSLCGTTVTDTIPALGTSHVWSTVSVLLTEPTSSAAGKYYVYCTECGARKTTGTTLSYSDYTTQINALKSSISSSSLGTSYTKLSTTAYNAPTYYPTARVAATSQYPSSPRVLINAEDIVALRNAFADSSSGDVLNSIVKLANNYERGTLGSQTYHSSSDGYGPKGTHNCNEHILETVMAQALLYQITGADLYGYKAIKIIKEYISTVKITTSGSNKVNDACRTYGYVMFTAGVVYDWCRDLLTETDKKQIIYGVEKNLCSGMEVGFPPSGQGGVSGHGSERQILRDYLSFAIAIYDDEPTWYQYIAGRVYQEYVPVRNAYYSAGYTPQGLSNYLPIRYTSDLWSAWLLKSATGKNPYNEADMKNVMKSVYANFIYATTYAFEEGDSEGRSAKQKTLNLALPAMMSAYVLDDATGEVWARKADYAYTGSVYLFIMKTGTKDLEKLNDRYDDMSYITYNGGFESRIIAHNSWTKNDAAVFMKIGGKTTANHDHADAGSFQIYYKALLTGDSGCYDSYGSTHHTKYHQATVAHNSILIYNGTTGYGQNQPGETTSFSTWSGTKYDTGETTGVAYAYDKDGKPLYAYIAGELSGCYNTYAGASRVERRMLTVYDTENASSPMFVFVFDAIKTSNTSYRKAFLLHTPTQPTINGNTVTVVNGDGKLVLQNVTGNAITTAGHYEVNGSEVTSSDDDGMWGRVEISATGEQESFMLNAMYVTGSSSNPSLTATNISNDVVSATKMGAVVAAFVKSADRRTASFSITTGGSGDINYYISGVAAGTWTATVGGKTVTATATIDGGILSFTAPAGTVTLTKN